jgi:hypothetical protein
MGRGQRGGGHVLDRVPVRLGAQPVLAFDTKQPRADENGEPLYVVQLIALAEGEAEILAVKVPGLPSGIRQGHPVKGATRSRSPAWLLSRGR